MDRHEEVPDRFRVRFRAGAVSSETSSKIPDADGSIEWKEPLDIRVYDRSAKLVAVIQQYNLVGGWVVRPDRAFQGSSVTTLPDTWHHTPDLPTAPKFHAELSVHCEEEELQPFGSTHIPEDNYSGIPTLDTPSLLYSLGRGSLLDSGDGFKTFSPLSVTASSVTASSSTGAASSVGGGKAFFGEGATVEISPEGSPASSARPVSRPPPVSPIVSPPIASLPPVSPAAPLLHDDVLPQEEVLSAAVEPAGFAIRFPRPELATSRSFSCSPVASRAAPPSGGPSEALSKQRHSPDHKGRKVSAMTAPFRRGLPSPRTRSWWPNIFRSPTLEDVGEDDRFPEAKTLPGSPANTANEQHKTASTFFVCW